MMLSLHCLPFFAALPMSYQEWRSSVYGRFLNHHFMSSSQTRESSSNYTCSPRCFFMFSMWWSCLIKLCLMVIFYKKSLRTDFLRGLFISS
jgi:hypothetical protein